MSLCFLSPPPPPTLVQALGYRFLPHFPSKMLLLFLPLYVFSSCLSRFSCTYICRRICSFYVCTCCLPKLFRFSPYLPCTSSLHLSSTNPHRFPPQLQIVFANAAQLAYPPSQVPKMTTKHSSNHTYRLTPINFLDGTLFCVDHFGEEFCQSGPCLFTEGGLTDGFYFTASPLDQTIEESYPLRLPCAVTPDVDILYSWVQDGVPVNLTREAGRRVLQEGSNLQIVHADRDLDKGVYHCQAFNKTSTFSSISRNAKITVACKCKVPSLKCLINSREKESALFI
ncbi:unnamed protein product [Protopolystoma xenopodis]|uniref:Ig-like domain-containing protein n=1 Tax=Protopolystoma xenopodis TaxID=117903 RepID=A0A3S5AB05_9PLAT|nr:unnamed protein product [Protopolystoma xenopodis]